jgi:sugar O-acyltransferase (sialic acid O-acetyltransferase NeuD family)
MASPGLVVTVPMVNVNDQDAVVAEVHVRLGSQVKVGGLICSLETTKATFDVEAEADGYVLLLNVSHGQRVTVGDPICTIGTNPPEAAVPGGPSPALSPGIPEGVRLTKPAERLAEKLNISLHDLPRGVLVTENMIQQLARAAAPAAAAPLPEPAFDARSVLIYGGGAHARSVIDLLRRTQTYRSAGIIDDGIRAGQEISGIPVLGGRESLAQCYAAGLRLAINAIGAIGNLQQRVDVFREMEKHGFAFPAVVHSSAVLEPSAAVGGGAQVFALAYLGSAAEVGFGAIVNTGAIVSHDCHIGVCAHIAPGAILAGRVRVGAGTIVGMGVTTDVGVEIGDNVRIGNAARIHAHVPAGKIIAAGTTWPLEKVD